MQVWKDDIVQSRSSAREMESVSIFCNRNTEGREELGKFRRSISSTYSIHISNICSGNSSNDSCNSTGISTDSCSSGNGSGSVISGSSGSRSDSGSGCSNNNISDSDNIGNGGSSVSSSSK
jgi:hypothetical protein